MRNDSQKCRHAEYEGARESSGFGHPGEHRESGATRNWKISCISGPQHDGKFVAQSIQGACLGHGCCVMMRTATSDDDAAWTTRPASVSLCWLAGRRGRMECGLRGRAKRSGGSRPRPGLRSSRPCLAGMHSGQCSTRGRLGAMWGKAPYRKCASGTNQGTPSLLCCIHES